MQKFINFLVSLLSGVLGAVIVVSLFLLLPGGTISDQDADYQPVMTDIGEIYNQSVNSVVTVVNKKNVQVNNSLADWLFGSYDPQDVTVEQGVGSGFVYDKQDGYYYAVTNNHVIEGSDEISVITTESSLRDELIDAEIVGYNPQYDIAVIRFQTNMNMPIMEFADSDEIYPGDNVYAIGSPFGKEFQSSITSGIISAPIRRFTDASGVVFDYIQTDAAINPGNSGGPLIDQHGQVVGMNTLKIAEVASDNMGFAIPSNTIVEIIDQIEENPIYRTSY